MSNAIKQRKNPMRQMTYRQALSDSIRKLAEAGIKEAENDAWLLMEDVFPINRTKYLLDADLPADPGKVSVYSEYIDKRCSHIPVQYITGKAYFMGMEFDVTPDVLIPRFDTEVLVEEALKYIDDTKSVLDMCTGSGCIAVSVSVVGKAGRTVAADISQKALEVAGRNAVKNHANNIEFIESDMYENVSGRYDVILSNPPYIPTDVMEGLDSEVKDCEPRLALDGHEDGLFFYRRLISEAGDYLAPGGIIMMEIGYDQGRAVSELLNENKFADIRVIKDLAGLDRVVCGRRT